MPSQLRQSVRCQLPFHKLILAERRRVLIWRPLPDATTTIRLLDIHCVQVSVLLIALDRLSNDVPLFRFDLHRECSAAASHQCWMALSDNLFYILWIVICASDDDQIFEPAGDEKFAILDETEIAS